MEEKKAKKYQCYRSKVVGFRMSPEEAKELDDKVALSGLSKREYITNCLLKHEIRVVCSVKVVKTMKIYLEAILEELQFLEDGAVPKAELMASLRHVLEILERAEA